MDPLTRTVCVAAWIFLTGLFPVHADEGRTAKKIVLVAGETAKVDVLGHHDYLAGCRCLEVLLRQTPGLEIVRVDNAWPADLRTFDGANAIVFYTDGGGKQAFLNSEQRVTKVQSLADQGVGIVMIHQAVDFPERFEKRGKSWLGGIYLQGKSSRGHWPSKHHDFPNHPICQGVTPWQINDGWLNGIQFVEGMVGITPLVWSGKEYEESRMEQQAQIVSWAYQRPDGGRSFSFTGLDAHSAWELDGLRQLVLNGVLWTANVDIPATGALSKVEKADLQSMLTPREPKKAVKAPAKKAAAPSAEKPDSGK